MILKLRKRLQILIALSTMLILLSTSQTFVSAQTVYVVNSTADTNDGNCSTSTNGCTLREAILTANESNQLTIINFNIPGDGPHTIKLNSQLPKIRTPIILDASTQPGASCPSNLKIVIDGTSAGSTADGITLDTGSDGSTIRGFVIQYIADDAILIFSNSNTVQCNFVGTNITGTSSAMNGGNGISLQNTASYNLIGGPSPADRNLVSGNYYAGIELEGTTVDFNLVMGNYIGTDVSGMSAIPNLKEGIRFYYGAAYNVIGTNGDGINDATEGNLISGNETHGINLTDPTSNHNIVAGNIIGLKVSGSAALVNKKEGIRIASGSHSNRIGTNGDGVSDDVERNVISGNGEDGVEIRDSGSNHNIVAGNIIGLDATGQFAIPNAFNGVMIRGEGATNNIIGSDDGNPVKRNVISGNNLYGVEMLTTSGNKITGNTIGLNFNGSATVGNVNAGIGLNGAQSIKIHHNVISGNYSPGIAVKSSSLRNEISMNSIWNNNGLGIDLNIDGVTGNDQFDADTGGNALQNYPQLAEANDNGMMHIEGSFHSTPNTNFLIEFFANETCDSSGYGEGQLYLGNLSVRTDGSGNAPISASGFSSSGQFIYITSTATDPVGNTSEFSQCIVVNKLTVPNLLVNHDFDSDSNGDRLPDNWVGKRTSLRKNDKIKCNKDKNGDGTIDKIFAQSGNCAFMFRGNPAGSASNLKQILPSFSTIHHNSTLTFSTFIHNKNVVEGAGFAKVVVKFSDGDKAKINLLTPAPGHQYQEVSGQAVIDLTNRTISKAKVKLYLKASSGKYFIDNIRLESNLNTLIDLPPAY